MTERITEYARRPKLAWINSEREDEPRWGDRHSVQTDEVGTPLYVIHCQDRSTIARWWVGDFLEWFKQDCWTLKEAKAFAQHHHDTAQIDGSGTP